jgi:uncharacterized repeat protein (TIGR01451 family)/CSLREA domain-containing protein
MLCAALGLLERARYRALRLLAISTVCLLAPAVAASAATFTVNSTSDAALGTPSSTTCPSTCTLREAVQAADNAGGSDTINLPAGTYTLTLANPNSSETDNPAVGDLDVNAGVTLTVTGAGASTTIINANFIDRAFSVQDNASLSLTGVTVEHGDQSESGASDESADEYDGGAIDNQGTVSISGSVLNDNSTWDYGGVIYAGSTAVSTSITNSTVSGNSADDPGGALYVDAGSVTLSGDTLTNNLSGDDGGGGALYDDEGGANAGNPVSITGSTLDDNTGQGGGGALYLNQTGATTISDSTFDGDQGGDSEGGAVAATVTNVSISGSTFDNDSGSEGGALYLVGTSPTAVQSITGSTFADDAAFNSSSGIGGAVADEEGNLNLAGSTFTGNSATANGGALFYGSDDGLALTNDTFNGNQSYEGGAVYMAGTASTGTVAFLNDTIARNDAYEGGGIAFPENVNSIKNTIVADNSASSGSSGGGDCYDSSATDNAHSADVGGNIDSDGSCFSDSVTGDQTGVNPELGPLASNGGPTETDALVPNSPAIGKAIAGCPSTDQRGVARPSACDVGAFQTAASALAITVSAPTGDTVGEPLTYTVTVTNHGPGPATDVTVSDTLPANTDYAGSTASQGSCSGTTKVTCALGTLDSSTTGTTTSATVTITVVPEKAGTLTDTATASPEQGATVSGTAQTSVATDNDMAPGLATGRVSRIGARGATFNAIIDPEGLKTTYSVQIGTSRKHLRRTVKGRTLAASATPKSVTIKVGKLTAHKTYYFRIVSTNANGTTDGKIEKFKTK